MSKNKKLIPELRFPEFKNEGEWDEKVLGEICNITNGKANAQDHVENGKYPLFDRSEVVKASNDFIFDCEAVIIPGEGMRFIPKYYEGKFNLHQRAYVLKDFICSGNFVYYSMVHRSALLSQKAVQSTVLSLRLPILQSFPIDYAKDLNEQQKISACLSSLDEVIALHRQKLELLKIHKKGLMQNLFPLEGKKVPKLRFKEFEKDGDWEEKKLAEILIEGKLGGDYENIESNEGVPIIKMGNLDRGKINLDKIQYLPQNTSYNADDMLKDGDLLFNTRNTLELVGKVAVWRNELPFALYNSNLMRMTFTPKYIASNFFMNYVFNTELGLKKLRSIATGTTSVAAIYTKDLLTIEISFPSKAEQQKIASILSALDQLITGQAEKIEQLKQHRKGLMQGLFPKMND